MLFDAAFFDELTCGNKSAAEFAEVFLRDAHLNDDFVDGDIEISAHQVSQVRLDFLMVISFSDFWRAHAAQLMPLVIQGAAAFVDATNWQSRADIKDRQAADVLKAYYGEVLWHVAFICGGYSHMRKLQEKYREFNYDACP